jgi:hypothetical protein
MSININTYLNSKGFWDCCIENFRRWTMKASTHNPVQGDKWTCPGCRAEAVFKQGEWVCTNPVSMENAS